MKFTEEEYGRKIFKILNQMSISRKKEFIGHSLKQLKSAGRTNQWVFLALNDREPANWEKWGFGLLFNEKYITYIDKLVAVDNTSDEELMDMFEELTGVKMEEEVEYV